MELHPNLWTDVGEGRVPQTQLGQGPQRRELGAWSRAPPSHPLFLATHPFPVLLSQGLSQLGLELGKA